MAGLKSELPVYIVDDHDKVLPFIHRAIGSKRLPFSGTTIIHFDAHPDLLIESHLKATDTFNKHHLYSSVSIATWLVPLLYAGHIRTVIWVKPPWAHQLPDGKSEFWVGECKETGKIKLTCTESYFLSESLYVSEDQLLNKKFITLITVTVDPQEWPVSPMLNSESEDSDCSFNSNSSQECQKSASTSDGTAMPNCNYTVQRSQKNINLQLDFNSSDNQTTNTKFDQPSSSINSSVEACQSEGESHTELDTETQNKRVHSESNTYYPEDTSKKQKLCHEDVPPEKKDQKTETESFTNNYFPKSKHHNKNGATFSKFQKIFAELEPTDAIILDIDLDFFSTKNPFLEVYTDTQYQLLKKLYQFTKPKNSSHEALKECVECRRKQLQKLEKMFQLLDKNPKAPIDHSIHRWDILESLVKELQVMSDDVDYILVHDAGCTCDDTELPHHISTDAQIDILMQHTDTILSCLPLPTIITMARSSEDEYCPPVQVDAIQQSLIRLLTDHYQDIKVERSYE